MSGPPLLYLVVFFAIPTLIMVLASFRTPGEFGGLAPLVDEAGALDLNLDSYTRFLTESVYAAVFLKSIVYALVTTVLCLALAYPLTSFQKKHLVWEYLYGTNFFSTARCMTGVRCFT